MLKQFLREEEGQSTVEYLLIIAVVVVIVTAMGSKMQKGVTDLTEAIMNKMKGQATTLMNKAQLQ